MTAADALPVLPDVPPISEFVPGYEVTGWLGFGAPKGTPAEIVERLNREVNAVLADADVNARLPELGSSRRLARRLRQVHRRGNREVGQGGQVRRP